MKIDLYKIKNVILVRSDGNPEHLDISYISKEKNLGDTNLILYEKKTGTII